MASLNLKNMAVAAGLALTTATAMSGFSTPAMAQQATKAATTSTQPAEQANPETIKIVNARLGELAPIIEGSVIEMRRRGVPEDERKACVAQSKMFVDAMLKLRTDPTYSEVIAKASMEDLQAMTRFATCTLPEGPAAKLNVCSTFGMLLSGKLASMAFDPKMIDIRPMHKRCPGPAQ